MHEFERKRAFRRFIRSRYSIAVLAILVLLLVRATYNAYVRYERTEDGIVRLRAEKSALEERTLSLTKSVEALKTDEGVEREIRSMYGVVKPGEELIVVVERNSGSDALPAPAERGWFGRFLDLFR